MTPERKEIEYWLSIDEVPPFVKECEIDWDKLVNDYYELKKKEEDALFQEENEKYLYMIENLTKEEVSAFESDGTIPSQLSKVVTLESDMYFRFNKLPTMKPTSGGFVFDDIVYQDKSDEEVLDNMTSLDE